LNARSGTISCSFSAGNLALATIANSALGFVYWWVSARAFTPTNVGLASADISLLILISVTADVGLGTLLQGEIPRRPGTAPHLVCAALLASLASAGVFSLAYLAFAAVVGPVFGVTGGVPATRFLLVVGIGVQTASTVLDAALIGMMRTPLRLLRNLLFSGAKLLFVVGAAALAIPEDWQLDAIIASWVTGQALASVGLAGVFRLRGAQVWHLPSFDQLRRLAGVAFWHYLLNLVATGPSLLLPVIIALVQSPEQNAPFYAAWMILNLAGVAPAALATVLFSVGSGAPSPAISNIRFSLFLSLCIGTVAAVGFWLLSNVALNMLNPVYSDLVGSDLRLLGLSVPLMAIKVHYMTVQRLVCRERQATYTLGALGAIEILLAVLGSKFDGLQGAVAGWLIAMAFEASCLWPTIWRRLDSNSFGLWRWTGNVGRRPMAPTELDEPIGEPVDVLAVTGAGRGPLYSLSAEYQPAAERREDVGWFMDDNPREVAR
jgi:O-antigen/teichoic acid export membrane protein